MRGADRPVSFTGADGLSCAGPPDRVPSWQCRGSFPAWQPPESVRPGCPWSGSAINDNMLRPSSFISNLLIRVDAITGTISEGYRSVKKHVLCLKIYLAVYHEIVGISNTYSDFFP